MTLGVLTDTILLRLNGGILNTESAIKREDIRSYVPAAVNWAMMKSYYTNIKAENNRDFPSLFYGTFNDITILRPQAGRPYFNVQKGYVPLPNNAGIRFVMDGCGNTYTPLADSDVPLINYYSQHLNKEKFFRPIGKKVELYGLPKLMNVISYQSITDVNELNYEDELPIQAGQENDVIDITIQFFTGQRAAPGDKVNNKADINVQ